MHAAICCFALRYILSVAFSLGFISFWSGGTIDTRNLSPHFIVVNYPMVVKPGEPTGHTKHNGVTRFVKGTQNTFEPTPILSEVRSTIVMRSSQFLEGQPSFRLAATAASP